MSSRFIMPRQGVKGQNLTPADGAKLHFKVIGQGIDGTNKTVFTDEDVSVAATNPVIADSKGLFEELWLDGDYDTFLTDKNDNQLWGPETIRDLAGAIDDKLTPLTVSVMVNDARFSVDDVGKSVPVTKEFSTGNGGSGTYDIVLTSSVTTNPFDILEGVADDLISFVLRVNGLASILSLGSGTTINIGASGVFTNLNDAVDYVIQTSSITESVTFNLLAGFIMSEQILIDGLDLSEITITSADAEVVAVRSALTTSIGPEFFGAHFPLFGVTNGGTLPVIDCLFNMDASGTATNRDGIYGSLGSTVIVLTGGGIKNAGFIGCLGHKGVTMALAGAIFDNALDRGIWARDNCNVDFEGGSAIDTGLTGFQCHNSIGSAKDATLTGNAVYGLRSRSGSIVEATGANCSNSGTASVNLFENSHLNAPDLIGDDSGDGTANAYGAIILGGCTANLSGATFTGIDGIGVRVASTGFANLTNVDASGSSGNNPNGTTDFVINGGGAIALLSGSTGTVNIVANTFLRDGLAVDSGKARFYEEGTFIPVLEGSGTAGSHTYSLQEGNFVRNGNVISMSFAMAISSLDGSWSGNIQITDLPDSIDQNLYWDGSVSLIQSIGSLPGDFTGSWHIRPITSGTLRLEYWADSGLSTSAPVSVAGSSFALRGSITFMTEALQ